MTDVPPRTTIQSHPDAAALARRPLLWVMIGAALVIGLLALVVKGAEWKAASDARNATAAGSATFAEIATYPSLKGVLDLTGQFNHVDHSGRKAFAGLMPLDFVDPIPAAIGVGDLVQVTCRVQWSKDGVLGPLRLRVDVCRDILLLDDVSG